ncbi:MAG: phage tail protein [Dehalococcoidales bacterium]|nr:phage tail protein [Dehalococcoidales bacterium]
MPMKDPLVSFHFFVEAGDVQGAFRDCAGLGSESDIVEYKASDKDGNSVTRKVPGRVKWENIVLKRGITDDMAIWKWRKTIEEGKVESNRRNGSIVLYNQENTEVARWNFKDAWPSKVTGPQLNAQSNEIAIEELTLVHEGITRDH